MQESDPALAPAIAHAEDVAKILRENVVQGKMVEKDGEERYSEFLVFFVFDKEGDGEWKANVVL